MFIRCSKIALVCAIAFNATLIVFNNLSDYGSNYLFVAHVLRMDTTFPGNRGMWRAIDASLLHHLFYWVIILIEAAVAVLCWWGGVRLFRRRRDPQRFDRAKGPAVAGLTLGIVLWFSGFITVGGEWFLMWQSDTWNGTQAAFRLLAVFGITLLYLARADASQEA